MRTERCACGGYIRAASVVTSRQAVGIHNLTLPHLAWRMRMGIETPTLHGAAPNDPRRQLPTVDDDPRDVSGETGDASTTGVEGAA